MGETGRVGAKLIRNVEHERGFAMKSLVDYEEGKVNSLTLSQTDGCKVTVFAVAQGEGMGGHAAPGDAMPFVLEGAAEITIDGVVHEVGAGSAIVIPSGAVHSLRAVTDFKMLLTVVKPI